MEKCLAPSLSGVYPQIPDHAAMRDANKGYFPRYPLLRAIFPGVAPAAAGNRPTLGAGRVNHSTLAAGSALQPPRNAGES
jgi:hypothetical protein